MPKKASSKNREWEKDRRDRLNVALENLSKALPLHDASVALSKFDIVQRAIRVVQDQEDKVRALLSKDHSMILKTQEQLEDGFKVMLVRNAELVALLKKHKIKVPPFTPPSILSCVVINKDGDKVAENSNCTAIHGTQKQQQNSKLTVTEDSKTIKTKPTPLTSNKTNTQIATITPLLNGSLIPVRIIKRYRMICPALRDSGKVAIPRLRPSPGRNKKTALLQKLRHKVIKRSGRVSKTQNVQTSNEDIKENCDEAQKKNAIKRANGEILESSTTTIKQPKLNDDSVLNICSNHMEAETAKTVPSEILTSLEPQSKETQPSPPNRCDESQTLSIDILNGLPDTALVENCPDTLSPTAAFLMSFPVVSAAEKRIENHEPTEDEPCSAQELLQCEVKQADHINILENISSLLTTRDFERFVSDDSMASKSVAANLKEMEGNPERSEKREIVAEVQTCKEYPEVKICEFVKPQPKQLSYYSSSRKEPQCSVSNEKPSFSFSLTTASSSFLSESGFYDSLSNIGSSSAHHRTDPTFVSSPYISNPIMPNLYIHPESTTSMNFCPKPDTPQTPFTFSLTSTTQTLPSSKHSSSLVGTISTSVKPITTLAVSKLTNPTSHYHHTPSIPAPTTIFSQASSYNDHLATNNNYNPFAFDNIPAGPPIKSDSSQFTFSLTSTTNSTPINTPSFSAHPRPQVSITNPFSIDHNILSDQRPSKSSSHNLQAPLIPPHSSSSSSSSSTTTTTQCYPPKTTSTFAIPTTYHQPHQPKASPQKSTQKSQHKSHVNWMTSTDDFNPTSTDSLPVTFQTPKHPDISYMHSHEDAFSWSPNKLILDSTTHASLPNLHGDLALNNYVARPHLSSIPSTKRTKKPEPVPMPSNFSVCQLVDQRKSVNSFRSSEKHKEFEAGDQKTRAKTTQSSSKEKHRSFNYSSNIFVDSFTNPSPITTKPTISSNSNNYSTESLLSSQCSSNTTTMLHQHHRDKFLGSYLPTTADFHHPPPDPSAVPPMDFVSDPFYPNNYLPQKLHCPSDNVYPEPEYTNTPHYPIRTRTSNQQTSSFPQTHTAHVYPFSSSSSSGGRTADAQKPQNFHSNNYFATSTHSTTTTTEPSSSSSVIHHHHPSPHPHQQHQSHHHPQHYAHHQHFPPYHDPTTSTARSNQQPFGGGRHHLQSQQVSAPAASSSSFHPGGPAPSYGAPSHLVSDFNLSTICPEINNDKGVVATAVGQQNW